MENTPLANLPDTLRNVLTDLPVFYLLEYLGRNPGSFETPWGLASRAGISHEEAASLLERLVTEGILSRTITQTGERLYRLSPDPTTQSDIMGLAERVNRSRDAFLRCVREILRHQAGHRHA